jgi:large subunit ribosomal protein L9
MAKNTEVILIKHVKGVGALGSRVKVSSGFARNFLVPQGHALYVNEDSLFRFKALKEKEEKRLEKVKVEASEVASKLVGVKLSFTASTHDGGKLYGSISPSDIVSQIAKTAGVTVDKKLVTHQDGLRTMGVFSVEIELHPEVKSLIEVTVVSDTETYEEIEERAKAKKKAKQEIQDAAQESNRESDDQYDQDEE